MNSRPFLMSKVCGSTDPNTSVPIITSVPAPDIYSTTSSTWSSLTVFGRFKGGPVCVVSTHPPSLWPDIAELSVVRTMEAPVSRDPETVQHLRYFVLSRLMMMQWSSDKWHSDRFGWGPGLNGVSRWGIGVPLLLIIRLHVPTWWLER